MVDTSGAAAGEPSDLQARLRRLEDEGQLRALLYRYAINADLPDREDEWLSMYTEDAYWEVPDLRPAPYRGKDGLREFISSAKTRSSVDRTMHIFNSTVFYIDGDEAVGEGFGIVFRRDDDGVMQPIAPTMNRWKFRRVDGEWLISYRLAHLVGSPSARDIFLSTLR